MYSVYMTVASHRTFRAGESESVKGPAARWLRVLCVVVLAVAVTGCAQTSTADPPAGVEQMAAPVVLHKAAVSVFEEEGLEVDVASEKHLFVTSSYAKYDKNLKRRYKAEVIRGPEGVMGLKVTVDYKRRYVDDGEEQWVPFDNAKLRERARPWEIQMGRAIESRFEAWAGR